MGAALGLGAAREEGASRGGGADTPAQATRKEPACALGLAYMAHQHWGQELSGSQHGDPGQGPVAKRTQRSPGGREEAGRPLPPVTWAQGQGLLRKNPALHRQRELTEIKRSWAAGRTGTPLSSPAPTGPAPTSAAQRPGPSRPVVVSLGRGSPVSAHGLTSPVHKVSSKDGQTHVQVRPHQLRSVLSLKPAQGAVTSAQSSLHTRPPNQPLTRVATRPGAGAQAPPRPSSAAISERGEWGAHAPGAGGALPAGSSASG